MKINRLLFHILVNIVYITGFESKSYESYMKAVKDNLNERVQSYEYASMETFLKSKKYDQKIIKLESFIDDIYGYEEFQY